MLIYIQQVKVFNDRVINLANTRLSPYDVVCCALSYLFTSQGMEET